MVRWTAPAAGNFAISAYWRDIDPAGGNGATAFIFINGASAFSQVWGNGGPQAPANLNLTFGGGEFVDFLLDASGDYGANSTVFNATITSIPEPATYASAVGALALLGAVLGRRKQNAVER